MRGIIVKGIAGFYYVHVDGRGVYECKAKGSFRNSGIKPLVGDRVEIEVLDDDAGLGNITAIDERSTQLVRPAVANVEQALVIFAATSPEPNFNLLDRFLVNMEYNQIPVHICFNKTDLCDESRISEIERIYSNTGYHMHFIQAKSGDIQDIREVLKGHITTVAGPSGVGKSTLINSLMGGSIMETGAISERIGRGKHTTRHCELLYLGDDTFIVDTPGFSSMYMPDIEAKDLRDFYPEFEKYSSGCRFMGCVHINEPDCGVKKALAGGDISKVRYENYVLLHEEISQRRRY